MTSDRSIDAESGIAGDPRALAALVRQASEQELAEGVAANREQILDQVFRNMPHRLDVQRAAGVDAVIDWEIGDRPDGGHDRFQVVIRDGECRVRTQGPEQAAVTYTLGAVDFLKLVSGGVSGPKLFVFGRLKVRGDLVLAARVPSLFHIPGGE